MKKLEENEKSKFKKMVAKLKEKIEDNEKIKKITSWISKNISWIYRKLILQEKHKNIDEKSWPVSKGEIFVCDLGKNIGHEQNKKRPVIIASHNKIGHNSGNVIAIPCTRTNSEREKPKYRSQYILKSQKYSHLKGNACVLCESVTTVSKSRLGDKIDEVNDKDMKEIDKRLKFSLDIDF